MSTPEKPDAPDAGSAPSKRKPMKRLLLVVPLLAIGAGGAYAYTAGLLPLGGKTQDVAPAPRPVLEPGSTAAHPRYKTSYYKIDGAFTTNLAGSSRFVQVEIGVATIYDATVLARVQTHELPIRSAVLGVLAQQSEDAVATPGGRAALQTQLRSAINHVLIDKEGFGGITDVYLTGLVVQ